MEEQIDQIPDQGSAKTDANAKDARKDSDEALAQRSSQTEAACVRTLSPKPKLGFKDVVEELGFSALSRSRATAPACLKLLNLTEAANLQSKPNL